MLEQTYSENGDELKKFNTKDGMGVAMLRENGIKFGIITGERIGLVQRRALKVKADECHIGISDKLEVLDKICAKYGLTYEEIAYIGDDRNDAAVISAVGFGCSVADGMEVAKKCRRLHHPRQRRRGRNPRGCRNDYRKHQIRKYVYEKLRYYQRCQPV